ncbi:MAG: hypothetical protein ACTHNW_17810 [Mucilaginibacter sp.]
MEELIIFRLFLAFPVIGLLIPDVGLLFSGYRLYRIPATHLIIEITLSICIGICSLWIVHFKRREERERKLTKDKSLISA